MTSQSERDTTWLMLRIYYYPQFAEGVVELPWSERYETLRTLYDVGNEVPWEIRSETPMEDMMEYVSRKGYFKFFCAGTTVGDDGSFKFHPLLTECLSPHGF